MILKVGATPVFVDVDPRTRNLDLDRVEARDHAAHARDHADRTSPACRSTWTALYALAARHGLRVIEDAALAIGSRWQRPARSAASATSSSFSFHPNKNITDASKAARWW